MRIGQTGVNRRWVSLLACAVLVFVSLLPITGAGAGRAPEASAGDTFILDEQDDGRQVELKEGQLLVVTLVGNPSTGHQWEVVKIDERIVREVGEIQFKPQSDLLGAPAQMTRRFEAVGSGQSDLVLAYRRPWEDDKASQTFTVQVRGLGPFAPVKASAEPVPVSVSESGIENGAPAQGLPSSFNWCDLGGCTPVKNQGNCGSCWAFATVGPFESQIQLQDGLTRDLSEQYLVSCNTDGYGCDGGWWAHDYHVDKVPPSEPDAGAVYEADFPYAASDLPCNPPHPHYEKLSSWHFVGFQSGVPPIDDIKQAIYDHGPVAVAVCVNSTFQGYESGVFSGPTCWDINHAVVLVGWDDSLGSTGAWRLRNSWGPDWGEDGYMWIEYGISYVGYSANHVVYEGNQPPNAPSDLVAAPVSKTGIRLWWVDNSSDETGFRIERSLSGLSGWSEIGSMGADVTTYADRALASDTTYYYQVLAYNEWGDSGYSNVDSAKTWGEDTRLAYVPLVTRGYRGVGTRIENGDFENGPDGWTASSSNGRLLIRDSGFPSGKAPHGGSWAVWLGGKDGENGYIEQQVRIPASRPYLHYWHWIESADLCGYDFAYVRIDGTPVDSYDLCGVSNTAGWEEQVVDLGAYADQIVSLQFHVETDALLVSSLFIDDVSLEASASSEPGIQTP